MSDPDRPQGPEVGAVVDPVRGEPVAPPVAGEERTRFIEQAQIDFQDFAIVGDAEGSIEDGILVLRVDLRPPADG